MKTEYIPVLTLIGSLVGYYYSRFEDWWNRRQGEHYFEILSVDGVPMIFGNNALQCSRCLYVQPLLQVPIKNKKGLIIGVKINLERKDQVHSLECPYYIDKFKL